MRRRGMYFVSEGLGAVCGHGRAVAPAPAGQATDVLALRIGIAFAPVNGCPTGTFSTMARSVYSCRRPIH